MRRLGVAVALSMLVGMLTASSVPVGAAGAWETMGVAKADGWFSWAPEAMTDGQTKKDPAEVRIVVFAGASFGNKPFGDAPYDSFSVEWELRCNMDRDPVATQVTQEGTWERSGKKRVTKRFTSVAGQPMTGFDHCALRANAAMWGTGQVVVKTQAKY